jgi:signal transduction histidine kinase
MVERGSTGIGGVRRSPEGFPPAPASPVRRFLRTRPWLVDAAVSLVFTAIVVATLASQAVSRGVDVTAWHVVAIGGTAVALLFRRRAPLTVLAVVTLLTTVVTFSAETNLVLAVPIALYAVAAFRSPALGWISAAVTLVVTAASLVFWLPELAARLGTPTAFDVPVVLLTLAMADVVGVLLGANTWERAERVRALTQRAEQLARERDSQAQIATLAERGRIAREMHDIVAHSLSVMISLADGARAALERNPAQATLALDQLTETGRGALRDMQQVLSVLGETTDAAASREPAPGHGDLANLIERFRTAGLPVRFTVSGAPAANAAVELAVYRIVQEALTNALRYGHDVRQVHVHVDYGPAATVATITDDGQVEPGAPAVGSGRGIIGMGERAAVFGGTVEAGPLPTGGWRVHAVLPRARPDEDGGERGDG